MMSESEARAGAGELLPCPFCGKQPAVYNDGEDWIAACVNIDGCSAEPGCVLNSTREEAVRKWNTRAPATPAAFDPFPFGSQERVSKETERLQRLCEQYKNYVGDIGTFARLARALLAGQREGWPSPGVARKLLAIRDALAQDNDQEAYHQLYAIADPKFDHFEPWEALEKIAAAPPLTTEAEGER